MSEFLDLHDDTVSRRVLYLSAALLVAIPLMQAIAQLWPLQLSNIQWRFGAANAVSSVLLLPFLGLALLLVIARGLGQRGLARTVGVVSLLIAAAALGVAAVFVLDTQELKAIVNSSAAGQFRNTTIRVSATLVSFVAGFGLLGVFSFLSMATAGGRASGKTRAATAREKDDTESPLIVGR